PVLPRLLKGESPSGLAHVAERAVHVDGAFDGTRTRDLLFDREARWPLLNEGIWSAPQELNLHSLRRVGYGHLGSPVPGTRMYRDGAAEGFRSPDLLVGNEVLWPAELLQHGCLGRT